MFVKTLPENFKIEDVQKLRYPICWRSKMCGSRKNPYPPYGRSLEILRGRGVLKAKILEAKYDAKLEFPEGRGV